MNNNDYKEALFYYAASIFNERIGRLIERKDVHDEIQAVSLPQ